jgi:hypothetical protein
MLDLQNELAQFTGAEHWTRHAINRHVTYTEGVKHFAEKAGAFWFIDVLALEAYALFRRGEEFVHIKMAVADHAALITADNGNGKALWTRKINYTDCPDGTWEFYMATGGPENTVVIMLPSEY